jgi:hypothetical protein
VLFAEDGRHEAELQTPSAEGAEVQPCEASGVAAPRRWASFKHGPMGLEGRIGFEVPGVRLHTTATPTNV